MRKVKGALGALAALVLLLQAGTSVNAHNQSPPGNNGDIKIHDAGTAQADNRNEPKVCRFYIDGFNFDAQASGKWWINGQGQTDGHTWAHGSWGPADGKGNWRTGVMTLPDGHYKASAEQLMPNDPPGGAKTKVFKVECGQQSANGEKVKGELSGAINFATSLKAEVEARIGAAQQLLANCIVLTTAQRDALNAEIAAAATAKADLAAKLTLAGTALAQLSAALASGMWRTSEPRSRRPSRRWRT
jgi:hypothetical protein